MSKVTVGRFVQLADAHYACARLEARGISPSIADADRAGDAWPNAPSPIRVEVDEEEGPRARGLMAAEFPHAVVDPGRGEHCPVCHSVRVATDGRAYTRYRWRCESCGHRYTSLPPHPGPLPVLTRLFFAVRRAGWLLLRAPLSMLVGGESLPEEEVRRCWACGSELGDADRWCGACRTPLPDPRAYASLVTPGRRYDDACARCAAPFAWEDYRQGVAAECTHCGARLADHAPPPPSRPAADPDVAGRPAEDPEATERDGDV